MTEYPDSSVVESFNQGVLKELLNPLDNLFTWNTLDYDNDDNNNNNNDDNDNNDNNNNNNNNNNNKKELICTFYY